MFTNLDYIKGRVSKATAEEVARFIQRRGDTSLLDKYICDSGCGIEAVNPDKDCFRCAVRWLNKKAEKEWIYER